MTREQAEKFCRDSNGVLNLNCISYIIRTETTPPQIVFCKLPEVMQGGEYPIQADTPEHLFNSICEATEKHFISNLKYIKKCISFDD